MASHIAAGGFRAGHAFELPQPAEPVPVQSFDLAFLIIMEGIAAASLGAPISDNPYRIESEAGIRWQAGWIEARTALMETPHNPHLPRGGSTHPAFSGGVTDRRAQADERAAPF
jgi:hypothetical protein